MKSSALQSALFHFNRLPAANILDLFMPRKPYPTYDWRDKYPRFSVAHRFETEEAYLIFHANYLARKEARREAALNAEEHW